jgi:predicted 3-demethylubiquinone-9 3-methyltransferase (glyoxalase superfamily)
MEVSTCVLRLVGRHLPTDDLFTLSAVNSYVEWQLLYEVNNRDIDVSTYVKADNLIACQWFVNHAYLTKETVFQTWANCTVLGFAAFWGSLSVCKWISNHFNLSRDYARKDGNHALTNATEKGHLSFCIWLVEHFKLTKKDAIDSNAFSNAACRGHLSVCQWLHNRFKFTAKDGRHIIKAVCACGAFDVAKWLVDHFSLDKNFDILENNRTSAIKDVWDNLPMCRWLLSFEEQSVDPESEKLKLFKLMVERNGLGILYEFDYFLTKAASNCSFDICEWLIHNTKNYIIGCFISSELETCQKLTQHFQLTNEDIRPSVFRLAAKKGQLQKCQWLTRHFGLTATDARSNDNYALRMACKKGHLELCQWLVSEFELTVVDVRAANNAALRNAARKGYLNVCQWLTLHFGLTKEDAQSSDNYALKMAKNGGHLVVCQWLVQYFGILDN